MSFEIRSANPAVKALIEGTAPQPARLAAARGALPLPQLDLLEVLVGLAQANDPEISPLADATIRAQDESVLLPAIQSEEIAPSVLGHLISADCFSHKLYEAVLINQSTPANSIAGFATRTEDASLLDIISVNQQLLIANPAIIDALIFNPHSGPEIRRRATETKKEFFEKERGAQQVADELRARGQNAAAEFFDSAESSSDLSIEDALLLAQHIEVPDSEVDDSWLSLEYIEELFEETPEQRAAVAKYILGELNVEGEGVSHDRIAILTQILRMNMKDRMKLAMKGDREARTILIRDPNRVVAKGVIENPRITEQEVEKIAAMRSVPDEVLRHIANSRNWSRNYPIMHNLARNPRTPLQNVYSILTRLQLRDLKAISGNRNVSEAVRKQAERLVTARSAR